MPDDAAARREAIRQDRGAKERAIRILWQLDETPGQPRQSNLYAVLDAARDPRIYPGTDTSGCHTCVAIIVGF